MPEQKIHEARVPQSVCYPLSVSTHHMHTDRDRGWGRRDKLERGQEYRQQRIIRFDQKSKKTDMAWKRDVQVTHSI